MADTPQSLAARAQQAMQDGRLDEALTDLSALKILIPNDSSIWLMCAYANRAKGEVETACREFETATQMAPDDANIRFEYAKYLDETGDLSGSIKQYDEVLRIADGHLDTRINRLLVIAKTSKREEALLELQEIANSDQDMLRVWYNLAVLYREDTRFDEAKAAANHILQKQPDHVRAAHVLAQCAADQGEKSSHLYRSARDLDADNLDLLTGEAGALVQEDEPEKAIKMLEEQLERDPLWAGGHSMLAEIRWQQTGSKDFAKSYDDVLKENPQAIELWSNYIVSVSRALGHETAVELIKEASQHNPDNEALNIMAANSYSELEEFDQAEKLFTKLNLEKDPATKLSYVRYLTKSGDYKKAEKYGMELVNIGQGADAWPFVSIAWRKLDDPRWNWLEGDHDFAQPFDIEEIQGELPKLAEKLRAMHKYEVHPFAQSLRGGTQTDGALFSKQIPEIQSLVAHLRRTIRQYLDNLPAYDEAHPLLSMNREAFRFTGSWSVRLTGSGFHVNHIHNQGNLSSAFYATVPDDIGTGETDSQDGWLAVGEPATELNTGLSALKLFEPKPGRLVLFPSTMWHGTRPFGEGERMSCAFDVGLFKD